MTWAERRQVGFRNGRPETEIRKIESPEPGEKATAEYTPVCRFAGKFGGKFL